MLLTLPLWMLQCCSSENTIASTHLAQLTPLRSEFHLQDHLPGLEPLTLTDSSKYKIKNEKKNCQFRDSAHCLLGNTKNCTYFIAGRIGIGGFPSPTPFCSVYFPAGTIGTSRTSNCERLLYNLLFNFESNSPSVKERYAQSVWRRSKKMPLKQRSRVSSCFPRVPMTLPRF